MTLRIDLLTEKDKSDLYDFELGNRDFFEKTLPSRGDKYYQRDYFNEIMKKIDSLIQTEKLLPYLIRDNMNNVVGRMNIYSIVAGEKAEIGYRMGEEYNGMGYCTKAVDLTCDEAFNRYDLRKLEARTSVKNIGSQIVLVKNGFEFTGRSDKTILINDKWISCFLFNKIKPE